MEERELDALKFPIGEFIASEKINYEFLKTCIEDVKNFPNSLETLVMELTTAELNYKYRPGGWTIKQVVHHCADSHMNSLLRFKLALTEDTPVIRPYFEDRFAELPDSLDKNLESSLLLLKGLHMKLSRIMAGLSNAELRKKYMHPEHGQEFELHQVVATYAWHSNHHLAHIAQALKLKY